MQLHPLFQNALHAPRPCFIRNPTGIIIHNFPIVTAMLNITEARKGHPLQFTIAVISILGA